MRLIDANKLIIDILTHDLICDDEQVDKIILNAPTVEAIPIEWLRRWANKNCMYCFDFDVPTEKHESWYAINDMIEDWRKENGLL